MTRVRLLFLLAPALLLAGTVSYTLNINPDQVRLSSYNGFDVVELASGIVIPDPGRPCLPEIPVTLVVPAHAQVTGVTVTPVRTVELGRYSIVPSQPACPLSKPAPAFVPPDQTVYFSDTSYPGRTCREFTTGSAAGFRLAAVNVAPLEYRPLSGSLRLHTRLQVKVDFVDGADEVTLTPGQRDRALVGLQTLVANAGDLARFSPRVAETDQQEIAYLVITNDAMAPEFAPFVEYRTSRGLRTEVRTVEWISRNYPGRDLQEQMRNLVKDCFQNRGLSYLLLAGDNAQVPSRRIRLDVFDETGDIPTDLYFGDLDYSWDSNHNNLFGEMSDSVDLYADVLVGRASVDKVSQVRNFIAKVRTYEQNPATDYIKRTLLPSGWLWRSIGYHGRFVNDSIANLTPTGWDDVKLEDPPSSDVVADSFNHGFAMFDPAGHGNASGVYDESGRPIYLSGNANAARNWRRFSIMTSLACDPGDFESEDCLAEYALNRDTAGCIGVMMNSRYGWGTPPSMGPSEKLCVRFYDHFFQSQEYIIGVCHSRSREEYAGASKSSSLWRWCMTEFNLLGDPAIDIWSDSPEPLTVDAPDTIQTGAQNLLVTVTRSSIPQTGALVCAWKDGEVFATGRTDGSGQATLNIHPASPGALRLSATCHNCLAGSGTATVVAGAPEPYVTFLRCRVDDAGQPNPNGILEPGETVGLELFLFNTGTGPATNTQVVLRAGSSRITVRDSTSTAGYIGAGDSIAASGLSLTASPDITPGSTALLLAHVTSDQGQWDLEFGVEVGFPGRLSAEIDTGAVALTVTARGFAGFDRESGRRGRGFRFPKDDTSCLNIASFCLAGCPEYIVDRFYGAGGTLGTDWQLAESVRARTPIWNADEYLTAAFNDAGHSRSHNVTVSQKALGVGRPGNDDWVVLVYDVANAGAEPINGYAGIFADFDMKATDRLHDVARTDAGQRTAFMRNVLAANRWAGVKLLTPAASVNLACIDHALYVSSDSGLSENMKYRFMTGQLASPGADRPFNWSVVVSTGPLSLPQNGRQRVAFAFVAADDSAAYLDACQVCQQWYDANVGVEEPGLKLQAAGLMLEAYPNPATSAVNVRFSTLLPAPTSLDIYSSAGRLVRSVAIRQSPLVIRTSDLPSGIYHVRLVSGTRVLSQRVAVVR